LGIDGVAVQRTPALVPIADVVSVAAGENASYALRTDGTLWAWGYNGLGQLGTGDTISSATPVFVTGGVIAVAAGQQHAVILKWDGTVWVWGSNGSGQLGNGTYDSSLSPIQVTSLGTPVP